ncbi:hypothetical protein [Pseudomonas putida]|uniref:Uncharacterized protein n=1 Tax=Pseudomonas putida TaxID=303 RepID=A0A1L7NPT3_PSEPU|nr:hypothetical protein [Pseudomonas putida]BAW27454.1 Putative uncharacterized protein [Pseudomonas putida]
MTNPYTPDFEVKACAYCKGATARCYACKHTGVKLTRRGMAARKHMITLLTQSAADLKVGDMMWFNYGYKKVASVINKIEVEGPRIRVHGHNRRHDKPMVSFLMTTSRVEMAFDGDQLLAIARQVEAYQATLNKDGTVSRRLKRAA